MDTEKTLFAESPDNILSCQHPSGNTKLLSRCHGNNLNLTSFDDDSDWSEDQSSNDSASSVSARAVAKEQDLHRTSTAKKAKLEIVSPLVRSIFENRKKVLNGSQKKSRREQVDPVRIKENPVEDYEKMVNKKVLALDEEVATFKKESKRLTNLAKEHEEGLKKLARERAEWEDQKKSQIQAIQMQQEEHIEKLKKEKKALDHRAAVMSAANPVQRKEVEELKDNLARQQEEHRGKELRLRLTVNRLKAMNEDLTKQILEMQDEIRRYESCLLSALDGRENDFLTTPFSKSPYGEANGKHAHTLPCTTPKQLPTPVALGRSSRSQCSMEENCDALDSMSVHEREQYSKASTPKLLSEQAKVLSEIFNQPWKAAHRAVMEDAAFSRAEMGPRLADWR